MAGDASEFDDALRRTKEVFSQELTARFPDAVQVMAGPPGVRRYLGHPVGSANQSFVVVRSYGSPLDDRQLGIQRAMADRLGRQSSHRLAVLQGCRLEREAHYLLSSVAGSISLHHILRHNRQMPGEVVFQTIRLVAEAVEDAVQAGWPRAMLDVHSLFVEGQTVEEWAQSLQLIVPPLPGPESIDTPVPPSSACYIPDLVLLACELFSMPVRAQRFRPMPRLSAEANRAFAQILQSGAAEGFPSAREFAAWLAGTTSGVPPERPGLHPSTTTTLPASHGERVSPAWSPPSPPVPGELPGPPPELPPTEAAPTTAFSGRLLGAVLKRFALPHFSVTTPTTHLRLEPQGQRSQPTISLGLGDRLTVGRGAAAHFVAQFAPRSPRTDLRTCLISREHIVLQKENSQILVTETDGANQSFQGGKPLAPRLPLGRHSRISIAGEYDLEMLRLDSWWSEGRPWQTVSETPPAVQGALVLRPGSTISALDHLALWLFTDAAFGLRPGGTPDLNPTTIRDVLGWFLAAQFSCWVVAAENDGALRVNGTAVTPFLPVRLSDRAKLAVGPLEWVVRILQ